MVMAIIGFKLQITMISEERRRLKEATNPGTKISLAKTNPLIKGEASPIIKKEANVYAPVPSSRAEALSFPYK